MSQLHLDVPSPEISFSDAQGAARKSEGWSHGDVTYRTRSGRGVCLFLNDQITVMLVLEARRPDNP